LRRDREAGFDPPGRTDEGLIAGTVTIMIREPLRAIIPAMTKLLFVMLLGLVFNSASPVVAQVISEHHLTYAIADFWSYPALVKDAAGENANSAELTLQAYLDAMAERNGNPDLDLYTQPSRQLLAELTMTPAQMDHITRTFGRCQAEPARIAGRFAVIRYAAGERRCSPWFLEQEDGAWRLDLATMRTAIGFDQSNAWHFLSGAPHPYAFGFADWRFDADGFPVN
jgi:hypothetical protein